MNKLIKNNFIRFFIFCLLAVWFFSGWPVIFNFPPKTQEVKALTTDTYYGTYDSAHYTMTNPVNAETDNTLYAYGGKNTYVVIQSWSGTAGSGTISGVRIYCQHYATTPDGNDYTLVDYSLDDWVSTGATTGQQVMPASESQFSVDITADRSWTWADIANLEVRAAAIASAKQNFTNDYIDVLYIQVDYTPVTGPSITAPASVDMPDYQLGGPGYNTRNFNDVSGLVQVTATDGFTVTVSSTAMTGTNTIPASDVKLKTDGTVGSNPTIIENCGGFSGVTEASANEYALDSAKTIVTTTSGTGTCDIYPTILVYISNEYSAGQDSGVLTFTVS